ncbi:MAG: glycogen synthase GlgA [Synoicihabitans sp.]
MNIVHVASEMFPYIKTGGLADVVGALARKLAQRGHQVSVFLPGYREVVEHEEIASHLRRVQRLRIEMGNSFMTGDVREFEAEPGLRVFLICREEFFDRKLPYGNGERDYEDNYLRFIFFCKGVIEVMRRNDLNADVLHSHDWPAGLMPILTRVEEERQAMTLAIRTVHTIHNIAFQGLFPMRAFYRTNLPDELMGVDGLEYYGQASMMKAGLQFADRITTVSPNYAREIQTPEFGCGLDGMVSQRADDLSGMINGIDTATWNPMTDPLIPGHFHADDLGGKKLCRAELLKEHGFDPQFKGPIYGMVCRVTEQKGIPLLLANEELIGDLKLKLIIVGFGDPKLEAQLRELAARWPQKVSYRPALSERMSHRIEAGSDFFLMPSLFEPCGLNQMYSQAYGTIPVAAAVGGLIDTIVDIEADPENGAGILVEPTAKGLAAGFARAQTLHADRKAYAKAQQNGMRRDFGWDHAVTTYEQFYADIV